jgi:hypothetical protein
MNFGSLNTDINGLNSFLDWLHENDITTEYLKIKLLKQEKKAFHSFGDELRRSFNFKPKIFNKRRL